MKTIYGTFFTGRAAFGWLIVRVVYGLGLALHGYQKFVNGGPFHWGDQLGIPPFWQSMAFCAEFAGGIAMILGLLTPLAALGIAVTMATALIKFHIPRGSVYVPIHGGPDCEAAVHNLAFAVATLFLGPGALSLDALFFRRRWQSNPYAP